MSTKIIQERLESYQARSFQEEEMALREITQEVALNALFNINFFRIAAFHGGTCLRIFYSLNRFSEDLDFALINPDVDFSFTPYLSSLKLELDAFGFLVEVSERKELPQAVRHIFIKDDSIGKLLNLHYPKYDGLRKSVRIKLEIDTNPPSGARIENKYHDFPLNFAVTVHDLPSLFAGKMSALLSRTYLKGRDWYDFLWYAGRKSELNFELLSRSLKQQGPWQGKEMKIDGTWVLREMERKVRAVDWKEARDDVRRFLKQNELKSLELWEANFFLQKLHSLNLI